MKKIQLLQNHRRSLSVTAHAVEKGLREIEVTLRTRQAENLTTKVLTTYSQEERRHLLEAVDTMRKANQEMIDHLVLEPSEFTEEQIVNAQAAHLWTILVDSKSKKLKNFGEVPKDHAEEIDRHIENLLDTLKQVM